MFVRWQYWVARKMVLNIRWALAAAILGRFIHTIKFRRTGNGP
jgi:hypothetical protein